MSLKIILGISLPLLIIIILVILSTSNIGFSVKAESVPSIPFNSLVGASTKNIPIQTITLTNDFFIPRRYELPRMIACLIDSEGAQSPQSLTMKYSEVETSKNTGDPILHDLFLEDYYSSSRKSVEIPSNSEKQIRVSVTSIYLYDYGSTSSYNTQTMNRYRGYDMVAIVELKDLSSSSYSSYRSCESLNGESLENSVRIPIS